ncbi:hypothetical protein O1611_g729 [Lasiodiplodia mahajangana]|uniref:Uncharacterized protein n=1 Tax=Lasiodiplodia mahajangana TaxID=1108764 RepID=A0ACC2JZM1_9PEZI|nr:hypothetical protein O1611_g729 [Lasiodiplodia mahajangana]
MECMKPKIESLVDLCKKYTPPSKANRVIKALRCLSAHKIEARIIEHLQSLEHDKTTLLITIQLLDRSISTGYLCPTDETMAENPRDSVRTYTNDTARDHILANRLQRSDDSDSSHALMQITRTQTQHSRGQYQQNAYQQPHQYPGTTNGFPTSVPGTSQPAGTAQSSTFEEVKIIGSRSHVGNSVEGNSKFSRVALTGDDNMVGNHGSDVAKLIAERIFSSSQQQKHDHQASQNVTECDWKPDAGPSSSRPPSEDQGVAPQSQRDTDRNSDKMDID